MPTAIAPVFERLELSGYTDIFIENGFDTWEDVLDITESDLETLNVRLGHRRRLQREIATQKGIAIESVIQHPDRASSLEAYPSGEAGVGHVRSDSGQQGTSTGKRRYRRHPKPDANAPERPPSAYVLFSNEVREELKAKNLSFTDMAKVVGERWQQLDTTGREPYETKAGNMKDEFNTRMTEYKKTKDFKEYQDYLTNFKAAQQAATTSSQGNEKRMKLDRSQDSHESSRGSAGTPTTSSHGSPISVSSSLMRPGLTETTPGSLSSPTTSTIYSPIHPASLRNSANASPGVRSFGSNPGSFEHQGPYAPTQPLPPISTDYGQRPLPRRSNHPPPPLLHRSPDVSTGSHSSQMTSDSFPSRGPRTPSAPFDSTRPPVSSNVDSPAYGQHHTLQKLSLGAARDRTGSESSQSYPYTTTASPVHPPFAGPEVSSRTLPPLSQSNVMAQQHQSRMDGLSVLALAGRMMDEDREVPPDSRTKPP